LDLAILSVAGLSEEREAFESLAFDRLLELLGERDYPVDFKTAAGSKVTLKIVRRGQPQELSLLIAEAPMKD
jgi:hypothetical protein